MIEKIDKLEFNQIAGIEKPDSKQPSFKSKKKVRIEVDDMSVQETARSKSMHMSPS